jgi:hypothetical protein
VNLEEHEALPSNSCVCMVLRLANNRSDLYKIIQHRQYVYTPSTDMECSTIDPTRSRRHLYDLAEMECSMIDPSRMILLGQDVFHTLDSESTYYNLMFWDDPTVKRQ